MDSSSTGRGRRRLLGFFLLLRRLPLRETRSPRARSGQYALVAGVSTYAYAVPVVAYLVGVRALGEPFHPVRFKRSMNGGAEPGAQ